MAQYIPKRDETLEADPHQKWLEGKVLAQDKALAALRAELDKLLRANAAAGKQVARINSRASGSTVCGLPPDGVTGTVLRKTALTWQWLPEWQGLMPEYWVSLDPAGGSYFVTKVGLSSVSATDRAMSKEILPPVLFDDGGLTMLPIETEIGSIKVHTPKHIYVDINPSFEGEEFTIYLPTFDNGFGPTAPFYTFKLENIGAYGAVVHIQDTDLMYEGTLEPVLGDVDSWPVPVGFSAAWTVRNVVGVGAIAMPVTSWNGSAGVFTDEYYETNIYTP